MCTSHGRKADAQIIGEHLSIYRMNSQPKLDITICWNEGRTLHQSIRVSLREVHVVILFMVGSKGRECSTNG